MKANKKRASADNTEVPKNAPPPPPPRDSGGQSSSFLKSILLSIVFLILLFMIKRVDSYSQFYDMKIKGGYEEIAQIKDIDNYEDLEIRKQLRWGGGYEMCKRLAAYIKDTNALLLVPPQDYIKKINPQFGLPEPSVLYYYCGLKSCWAVAKNVHNATHALIIMPQRLDVLKITNKGQIDSLINVYKPYPYLGIPIY